MKPKLLLQNISSCDSQSEPAILKPLVRYLAWLNVGVQVLFPLATVFTPTVVAASDKHITAHNVILQSRTVPWVLQPGESVSDVALRYHLSVASLKTLNQFRTFSKPFEQLTAGDEIDVPAAVQAEGTPASAEQTAEVGRWISANAAGLAQSTTGPHHAQVGDVAMSQARSAAVSGSSAAVSQWLNRFGTAQVQLGVDDHFSLNESALDLLVPLYDNGADVLFVQAGGRHHDGRTTLNAGSGVRLFRGTWMYGTNVFLDNDITGHNRRVGIGAEAWTDYLKLSANSYFAMTGWHQSRDFEDYNERPADGFDIAANAWLPAYPQLGGTMKYEQYQGDHVGLLGKDTLQKNPKALTAGLNWTPVPLVTLGTDYRNSAGEYEVQMQAEFTWTFGESLSDQLSGDKVGQSRTLAGSRLDLVERNNEIVLDYRKQDVVKLALPPETQGQAGSLVLVNVQVTAKYGIDHIDWQAAELQAAGGKIVATGPQAWAIQLPSWKSTGNRYPLHAIAWDKKGNASRTASGDVVVEGVGIDVSRSSVVLNTGTAVANGKSAVLMTLTVRDAQGNLISGLTPSISLPLSFTPLTTAMRSAPTLGGQAWNLLTGAMVSTAMAEMPVALANGGVTLSEVKETDTVGVYTVTLTAGTQAGTVRIIPHISGVVFPGKDLALTPVATQADTGPITAPISPLADGKSVLVTVPVIDAAGQPLVSSPVTLVVDGKDVKSTTDSHGNVAIDLPGQTVPGHHDYQVGVKDDNTPEKVKLDFVAVTGTAPTANTVAITGTPSAGETLTGSYVFTDVDGDTEGTSTYQWYRDSSAITGATARTYLLTMTDEMHTISFGVIPISATGTPERGSEIRSRDTAVVKAHPASTAAQSTSTVTVDNTTYTSGGDIAVTVLLKDSSSNPVSGASASLTSTAVTVAHATLKAGSSWKDNSDGSYTATYVAGTVGTGLKASVKLTGWATASESAAYAITAPSPMTGHIDVNGHSFAVNSGFPTVAYLGASFIFNAGNLGGQDIGSFDWSSDQSWVTVSNGTVRFDGVPTNATKTVTITAKSKTLSDSYSYQFTISKLFATNPVTVTGTSAVFDLTCPVDSSAAVEADLLVPGSSNSNKIRGIGSLYGEWADTVSLIGWVAVLNTWRGQAWYMSYKGVFGFQMETIGATNPVICVRYL